MSNGNELRVCCFFGHRKVGNAIEVKNEVYRQVENLIINKSVGIFLLGSKSEFNDICYDVVTMLKEKYPHIKRIYVRAEFRHINDDYKNYLLESYEDTYYPQQIENSGRASYVERNREMINKADYCVIYYDENYAPPKRKYSKGYLIERLPNSGTKVAYNFAIKKKKKIINIYAV